VLIAAGVVLLDCFSPLALADTPITIMPLGDSITEGAGSPNYNGYRKPLYLNLTSSGYNVDFVGGETHGDFADPNHEGHNGWHAEEDGTIYDINDQVYGWLVANPAEIVLLHIGTNDITWEDEDVNEIDNILDEIDRYEVDSNEGITVILALIINRDPYDSTTTQFNNDVNDMALNRIANGDDIIIVDMEGALNYSTDMADSVHPNDAGYAKMADVWYNALDNLLAATPIITSTPVTDAIVGQLYTYDVDANGCPAPTYLLTTYPSGMTIDSNTGLIEWTPTAIGDFNVAVEVSNGYLPDANQSFTITVSSIIEFDTISSAADGNTGDTLTWSHTIGSGDNRILVVGIAGEDNNMDDLLISSVTYNDINMSLVGGSGQSVYSPPMNMKTELYYLLDSNLPSSGNYNVVVAYNGNVNERCGGATSLANVAQQPAEAVDTNSNQDTDTISTNITTQTDSAWVVDIVGCGGSGLFTADSSNQTERFDVSSNSSTAAGSTKSVALAGLTTMSWSYSSGADQLAHSVAVFAPATRVISGHVLDPNGVPIDGVSISADNLGGSDTTDPNGYYEVLVPYAWSGTVTPTKVNYAFKPTNRGYNNVTADQLGQDYEDVTFYDLDWSGFIGWGDITVMGGNWLITTPGIEGDLNNDGIVDFLDLAEFALIW
jgi:lysophospholipase L1-like esterase